MINSKGSLVVVGDEGSQRGLVSAFVVPDCCGEREEALRDSGGDSGVGAATVSFEVELAFEGFVDGLDDLTERFEEPGAGPWWCVLVGGAQQVHAVVVEEGFELGAGVSLVGDEGLTCTRAEQFGLGLQQVAGDFAFIEFRVDQRERVCHEGEAAYEMQAQTPKETG